LDEPLYAAKAGDVLKTPVFLNQNYLVIGVNKRTEADLTEGLDFIKSSIKTDIFISEFGQEEGLRVRAESDPQVIAALNQLSKAKELAENAKKILAQRAAAQQANR